MFINEFSRVDTKRNATDFEKYCRLEGLDRQFELSRLKKEKGTVSQGKRALKPWKLWKRTVMALR